MAEPPLNVVDVYSTNLATRMGRVQIDSKCRSMPARSTDCGKHDMTTSQDGRMPWPQAGRDRLCNQDNQMRPK